MQTSRYYSAFAFIAPRDCTACGSEPCREHLDEVGVYEMVSFLCAGSRNADAAMDRAALAILNQEAA